MPVPVVVALPLQSDLLHPLDCNRPLIDLAPVAVVVAVPLESDLDLALVVVVALPLESDLHRAAAPVVVADPLDCHRSLVDLADLKPVLALVVVALPLESDLH